jgi:membrane peptidoglycan carboxypeptidase
MRQAGGRPLEQYPSFTLGFNPVSPTRLAAAYAAFAARGVYCDPIVFKKITDADGKDLPVPNAHCHQAIDKGVADGVNYILSGVLTKGTAQGNEIGRPAAGKTGTVDNFSAAWFAGYTPDLASAVWVGDPRGGFKYPMDDLCMDGTCYGQVFGATIPAPIWHDTMVDALDGRPAHDFHAPPGSYFSLGSGEEQTGVPDVRGMRVADAVRALRAAGFHPAVDPTPVASDQYPRGTVADTNPGAGSSAQPGTTVTIYVSMGFNRPPVGPPPPSPVPTGPPTPGPPGPPPTFPPPVP